MEFRTAFYLTFTLICTVRADYSLLPGDKRTVIGKVNEPFSTTTTLPGYYDLPQPSLVNVTATGCQFFISPNSHIQSHALQLSKWTPIVHQLTCDYPYSSYYNSEIMSTVTISGYMSYGLKWITFFSSQNLIPISVIFLTDEIWNDLATGSIQPQYSLPLVIQAKGKDSVTLTCSILTTGIAAPHRKLSMGRSNIVFYDQDGWSPVPDISNYPQIIKLEDKMILFHRVLNWTVKQTQAIDFYACNTKDYWLTHTIDWTNSAAAEKRHTSGLLLAFTLLFMVVMAK